ncbi:MAG: hypothetical protein AAFN12_03935 [Cyanobacteria bacterium J06560_2]
MTLNNNPSKPNLSGVHGHEATPEELARRDGYVQGRADENYTQGALRSQEHAAAQAQVNDSAASGMLTGLLLAILAAGVGAGIYFLTGDRTNVAPVAVPQIEKETTRETTIIEREVPSPDVSLPDVQIDVPEVDVPDVMINEEAPAAEQKEAEPAAAAESEQPAAETEVEAAE